MQGNPVLTLQRDASLNQLKLQFITEKNIPETLNGESGFHVYHVRMLTELLLRELAETDDTVSLREEEITGIAIASSLHDIGKAQVPKAILDFPGQLSPLEYDIVKKHAAFGEEMIAGASAEDVDPAIVRYAAEIARHHHERVDGTGYPDGLRGAEIPLCAQVVALADSYDALTSPRSYKEEYSQDVALQMISGGMCGIFDEKLVSCLVKVVNHRSLVELREALVRKQRVTGTAQELNLSRVLCIGNTEYLTKEFIDTAFGRSKVTVVGSTTLGNADRIKLFHVKKPSVRSIFETYEFDMVVYFSGALRWQSTEKSDSEELREVLHCIAELQPGAKMLYFSPLDSAFRDSTDRAILSSANERLCEFYARQHAIDLRIVQIPYLYSGTCSGDFLYRRFEEIYSGKTVKLGEAAAAHMHFISLGDLADLVARMIDGWKQGGGMLSIGDEFGLTFGALGDKLASLGEGISVDYTESGAMNELQVRNKVIRSEYGWFAKVSILEELPEQYARFVE